MQSIGFLGPGISLLGLNVAKSPSVASSWLTAAVGLSSFSHAGFLVNLQVGHGLFGLFLKFHMMRLK